jgi:hypothetical protein
MILELGMILTALYAFTKKPVSKDTVQAAPETSKVKVEEKKETQPVAVTGLQSVFRKEEENIFLNPAIQKIIGTGITLSSQALSGGVISGPGLGGVLAIGLSGQGNWTQPYSGIAESVINSVFPVLGTVIGGFLEGIIGKDPKPINPISFDVLREGEDQRILQSLALASLEEPYKTMASKSWNQLIEDSKKEHPLIDIKTYTQFKIYSSLFQCSHKTENWEMRNPSAFDMSLKNEVFWKKVDKFYLYNFPPFGMAGYPANITPEMWRDAEILWNLLGFPEEIKKDPCFGMIDPRSQVFYNSKIQSASVILDPDMGYAPSPFPQGFSNDIPIYRDEAGNIIGMASKQMWGRFESYWDSLKRTNPGEYKKEQDQLQVAAILYRDLPLAAQSV